MAGRLNKIMPRGTRWGLAAGLLVSLIGCNDDGLVRISGQVTFDGQPLTQGTISLHALDGAGPTEGGLIVDGRFQLPRVAAGAKKVEIQGFRVVGQQHANVNDSSSPIVPKLVQFLPAQYNRLTKLTFEVKESSDRVDFLLTSHP